MTVQCPHCGEDHEFGENGYMTRLCEECRVAFQQEQSGLQSPPYADDSGLADTGGSDAADIHDDDDDDDDDE